MAKVGKSAVEEHGEAGDANVIPVVRDSTFHRAVVDKMFIVGAQSDIELVCLQSGQEVTQLIQNEESTSLSLAITNTEVVRLRMSWTAAIGAAMNILRIGIESGNIDRETVLKKLSETVILDASDDD